jgi:aryl-alcohol dehydrogenase-like predicted oxidoreductase
MTEAAGTLQKVANRYKATPTQVAIAWLLAHSPVMLPIAGKSKVAHLEENVGAAALDIAPSDLADLDKLGE